MATISIDIALAANTAYGSSGLGVRGTITRSGENFVADNQTIGTSAAELVTMGDVSAGVCFFYLRNADTDPENFVTLYSDGATGTKVIGKLYAGQVATGFGKNGMTIGAKADTISVALEKFIAEDVSVAANSIEAYTPATPSPGVSSTTVSIAATIGATTITIANTATETVASCGLLSDWIASQSSYSAIWPASALVGGVAVGTGLIVNRSVATAGLLAETAGTTTFGSLVPYNGFLLMPINAASVSTGVEGSGADIDVASVITRI